MDDHVTPQLPHTNEHSIVNSCENQYKMVLIGRDHTGIARVSGSLELSDK